jgi:pSer/pThr/pTyr-binding forkhead associated (FHA) protein
MHKITINQTPSGIFLVCKLDKTQQPNIRELELFNSAKIQFALPFTCSQVKSDRLINYDITGKITLKQYLNEITNKQKFFDVIATFISALKECDANRLFFKNVLFDLNYIFVDYTTKQIKFLYIPIIDFQNAFDIPNTLMEIVFSAVFNRMENSDYVSKYIGYFKNSQRFSLVEFEGFVKVLSDGLYKEIKAPSGPLEAKPVNVQGENKCVKCGALLSPVAKFCPKCGQPVLAAAPNAEVKKQINPVYVPNIAPAPKDDIVNPYPKKVETGRFSGTTVLGEDNAFGTTTLSDEELNTPNYPYLIRLKSNEKISLNKPVFRIGKEKSYVDYFVADNGAVSRSHADIIAKDGGYYILDHNSTNKTYINGETIAANVEVQITNEMKIKLANEEFVFHLC